MSSTVDAGDDRRVGRPRDPSCDAAIVQSAIDSFIEHGYAALSVEDVAARAGVAKATIYRRYATKAELVVDALRCTLDVADDQPEVGDVRAMLLEALRLLFDRLRGPHGPLLVALAAERIHHPDLAAEFQRVVVDARRSHLRRLVANAVKRGELPADTDVTLVATAGPAILWHHALHGLGFPADLPDRIVALVLGSADRA